MSEFSSSEPLDLVESELDESRGTSLSLSLPSADSAKVAAVSIGVLAGLAALAGCADGTGEGDAAQRAALAKAKTSDPRSGPLPVYRFAKISNGAYFYTGNRGEKDLVLDDFPDFRYEGIAFYQSDPKTGVPVYRFANLGNGGYFYTASAPERDLVIQTRPDLRFEGSTFSVTAPDADSAVPVFRLANLNNGAYLYTTSAAERDIAVAGGSWRSEGVAFYTQNVAPSFGSAETSAEAVRFLLQAQFSASDADIAAVRAKGFGAWLDEQFAAPTGIKAWDWLQSRGYSALNQEVYYNQEYLADYFAWQQLLASPDGVRKRLALALSEYFVISVTGVGAHWRSQMVAHYWDLLVSRVSGNFRVLLEEVSMNIAMGFYLNTKGNQKEDSSGRQPDENYAREVMQLFTIGLYQLNLDGTPRRDSAGKPLETYTQSDITHLARVFTGYNTDYRQDVNQINAFDMDNGTQISTLNNTRLPMRFNSFAHSNLAVSFLGTTIAANTPGPTALGIALDTLFNHPNVGPFFCRQMIQRLVTSNPSPAYVARVAAVFNDNGAGVRGDLRAVFTAILLDAQARGPQGLQDPLFGKLREPMIRLTQWARTFRVTSRSGSWKIRDLSDPATRLGQSPLRSQTVFNFFSPNYVPPGTAMSATGATAPEFQIVSESTVAGYLNFLQDFTRRGLASKDPSVPQIVYGGPDVYDMPPDYSSELPIAHDAASLVRRLSLLLSADQLSEQTRAMIVDALNASPITNASSETAKLDRIASAVMLVMASAEYLVQK